MKVSYWGIILVLLSAAGFGVMPILALYAYKGGIQIPTLLLLRFVIAAGLLFLFLWVSGYRFTLNRKELLYLFLLGGIGYTAQASCYFFALKYISPSLTALLLYTYPILVAVFTFFIEKEKASVRLISAILLCFTGLALVLGVSWAGINLRGVGLGFASALIYSGYIVLGNRTVQTVPPIITSAFVTLFAALSFFTVGLAHQTLKFNFTMETWVAVTAIAIVSTVVAIFGFFKGMEMIGSTAASVLSMVEPLITIGLSVLLFGEEIRTLQMIGVIIVLSGAVLVVLPKQERNPRNLGASAP